MCHAQMLSLSHIYGAIETTVVINIPGVFMTEDGNVEMRAVLKECSHSKVHNFNLLSMLSLLHKQGWKIKHREESLIYNENRKGGVINFNIVVPTEKGAVYIRKFVHSTEVATVNTKVSMKVSINTALSLLGHRNEDSICKTAWELGWVLMCSVMMSERRS